MKSIVVILLFCCCLVSCCLVCCLGSSSAWAIDCLSAAGNPKTGWYAWREIDGRKCWFRKTGAMPEKSELHWPAKVQEETRSGPPSSPSPERTVAVAVPPPPEADSTDKPESKAAAPPQFFKTIRVRPATEAPIRLGNGQVDLMNGASVSAVPIIGSARQKPADPAPGDPFAARFAGSSN
jgi:hypothetical protein